MTQYFKVVFGAAVIMGLSHCNADKEDNRILTAEGQSAELAQIYPNALPGGDGRPSYCPNFIFGDIDKDGSLTAKDTTLLSRYLSHTIVLDECQKFSADVNRDAAITNDDVRLLRGAIGQLIRLPAKFGDLNSDGMINLTDIKIIAEYLAGAKVLTPSQMLLADVNGDNRVTLEDKTLMEKLCIGVCVPPPPPPLCRNVLAGDIDGDGSLAAKDTTLLNRHLSGAIVLDACQKAVADVNRDSAITNDDVRLLRGAIGQVIKLPARFGDLNADGILTMADIQLISGYLAGTQTLTPGQMLLADMNGDDLVTAEDQKLMETACGNGCIILPPPPPPLCRNVLAGDIDGDGSLTAKDTTLLNRHLSGALVLDACQKAVADVNRDSAITNDDVRLLRGAIGQVIKLPTRFGDLNADGILTMADIQLISGYLAGTQTLTPGQMLLADMNGDDLVSAEDQKLMETACGNGCIIPPPPPLCRNVLAGDIDGDGSLTAKDTIFFNRHLSGALVLDACQKAVADVNRDSAITNDDVRLLRGAIGQLIKLPARFGDLNGDGKVTMTDINMVSEYLAGTRVLTPGQMLLADIDGDDLVTAEDLKQMERMSASQ